ncbi:hypothetical protein V8F06_008343 [Rhypophila decipiens]
MHRNRAAGKVEDGTEFDRATVETMASPSRLTPTYDISYLSPASGTFQPPQYINPESLNSTHPDPAGWRYPSDSTGTQSFGFGVGGYGLTTFPESDWPDSSYFSEATSSAPFTSPDVLSGYDSVSPGDLAGNAVANSYDYEILFPIPTSAGPASPGSGPEPESCSSSPTEIYHGQPLGLPTGDPTYVSGMSPESKSMRGPTLMPKRRVSPSSSGMARPRGSVLEMSGDNPVDGGTGSKIQLRTAFRKAKTKRQPSQSSAASGKRSGPEEEEDQDEALTVEERRARNSHNIVEKQYRNRLNAQFVHLLAILPAEQRNGSSDNSNTSDNPAREEKRVSKADVLDIASRRIKALEEETARLEGEHNTLMSSVDAMTSTVMGRGLRNMK